MLYDRHSKWLTAEAPGNAGGERASLKRAADAAIAAGNSPGAEQLWGEVMKIIDEEALAVDPGHGWASEASVRWQS